MLKHPFVAGLWLGLEQKREKHPFYKALVRIRAKIEKYTLCCRALVRIRA